MTKMKFLEAVFNLADKCGDNKLKEEASTRIDAEIKTREKNRKAATNDELDEAVLCVLNEKGGKLTSAEIIQELSNNGVTINPKTQKEIKGSTIAACCKRLEEKGLVNKTWSGIKNDSYRYSIVS